MPSRRQWLWALAIFALTLLVRLPVSWVAGLLPAAAHCVEPSGSLWSGHCARAGTQPFIISDVSWTLKPWWLLAGRIDAHVRSADPNAPLEAGIRATPSGHLQLRDVQGSIPVGSGLLPLFPDGLSGTLKLAITSAAVNDAGPRDIHGSISALNLRQRGALGELGSYELRFADAVSKDGRSLATLRDTAGPLAVSAQLVLGADANYELTGTVQARASASPELLTAINLLGAADENGRRPFSLAGSF